MRIFRRSVVSAKGHDLSHPDVIALMNPYVIKMCVYHDDPVRSLELNVTGRGRPWRSWSVGCAIGRGLYDNSIEGSMDRDMPAIPVFVCSAVLLVEPKTGMAGMSRSMLP